MNRNQKVWLFGGSLIGAIGIISTWYAGRESYKRGKADGINHTMELINLKKELESTIESLEVIREFESIINLKKD